MIYYKDLVNGSPIAAVDHEAHAVWSVKPIRELLKQAVSDYRNAHGNNKIAIHTFVTAIKVYHYREHFVSILP